MKKKNGVQDKLLELIQDLTEREPLNIEMVTGMSGPLIVSRVCSYCVAVGIYHEEVPHKNTCPWSKAKKFVDELTNSSED